MSNQKISRKGLYNVCDYVSIHERVSIGINPSKPSYSREIAAKWTGEKRQPKRGEWYLSGAAIEAYKAPNDLSTPYHIAKLVRVKTETVTTVVEV